MENLRRETVTRYIEPFREGGSLPGLVEASDGFRYVVKWRGGGHGSKVLVAELLGGEIARAIGFKVPELVLLDTPVDFGRTEPDVEVQELLRDSTGLNLGLHFLSGALTMDPYVNPVSADEASRIVWLDMFLTNVDRTIRNTNMLVWHGKETWLIDHGASFFFHHSWSKTPTQAATAPFPYIRDHAMIRKAENLEKADREIRAILSPDILRGIVNLIPDEWLLREDLSLSPDELREAYLTFLLARLEFSSSFTQEALAIRKSLLS